jgi:imidazolonepropionase-like amidohydrolase
MGMDHRIGLLKKGILHWFVVSLSFSNVLLPGYDADLVIWDSHPLALGATPKQVFIDGIAQLSHPHVIEKPSSFQKQPVTPNFDEEAKETLKYDGLPPLEPKKTHGYVAFVNFSKVFRRQGTKVALVFDADSHELQANAMLLAKDGKIECTSYEADTEDCVKQIHSLQGELEVIDLEGGALAPGLVSFGSPLGLQEIQGEITTQG